MDIIKSAKYHHSPKILSDVLIPQPAFSSGIGGNQIKIYYVSDIHLEHHMDNKADTQKQINKIVKSMFSEELVKDINNYFTYRNMLIVFCGDTAHTIFLAKYFYQRFRINVLYCRYKCWKKESGIKPALSLKEAEIEYKKEKEFLEKEYQKSVFNIRKNFNYTGNIEIQQKNLFRRLVNCNSDKPKEIIEYAINKVIKCKQELTELKEEREEIIEEKTNGSYFEKPGVPIFVTLGNHETSEFATVESAVEAYKRFLNPLGITLLHNSSLTATSFSNAIIYGGIGFSKYNPIYNSETIITTNPPMTREEEIRQTDLFLEEYHNCLKIAKRENKHLIVLSHFPIKDWLKNRQIDSICTYFYGHTHQSERMSCFDAAEIYADNQIGYSGIIKLKSAYLGLNYNPFYDYSDGYHEITTEQYDAFMRYCHECVKGTGNIDRQLKSGNAKFYCIKRNGFYGFFVVNAKTGTKICKGGMICNISKCTAIEHFDSCLTAMVATYAKAMLPYRKLQEQISFELKQLGFEGRIHGCIVDIDFYNHIMINPLNGETSFYYSPIFGMMKEYNSFWEMLEDCNENYLEISNEKIQDKLNEFKNKSALIVKNKQEINEHMGEYIKIDIKNSIYTLSKRINQLQRLFDSNVLREWNDEWAQEFTLLLEEEE